MSAAPPKPKWETPAPTNATASSSKLPQETESGVLSTRDSGAAPRIPDRPAEFGQAALTNQGEEAGMGLL
jgi:hypothetical protein